jgi:hypothetical protein
MFSNPEIIIILALGVSGLISFYFLDRYLAGRRNLAVNTRYAQRLSEGRKNSPLHLFGIENRRRPVQGDLIFEPEIEVRRPGFFSRTRIVKDTLGRVVATHYEELTVNNRLSFVSGR